MSATPKYRLPAAPAWAQNTEVDQSEIVHTAQLGDFVLLSRRSTVDLEPGHWDVPQTPYIMVRPNGWVVDPQEAHDLAEALLEAGRFIEKDLGIGS